MGGNKSWVTEVIREDIVNAVTHRNFLDRVCVQVAVYDDRVEVTSPRMLYGGLTIEQIKEGGSKICNRCIAEVFSRMKIIESWGTGIKRMFSSCKEYGIRELELLEIGDSFRVNLYRPSYNEVHQSSLKNSPKSSPKEVNQTQQKILDMIQENPKITQNAMAEKLDITPSLPVFHIEHLALCTKWQFIAIRNQESVFSFNFQIIFYIPVCNYKNRAGNGKVLCFF